MSESDTARLANMSERIVNTTVEAEKEEKKQRSQVQTNLVQVRKADDMASTSVDDVAELISPICPCEENKRSKSQCEAYHLSNLAMAYEQKFKMQEEENEKLKNQLGGRIETAKMFDHAVRNILLCL